MLRDAPPYTTPAAFMDGRGPPHIWRGSRGTRALSRRGTCAREWAAGFQLPHTRIRHKAFCHGGSCVPRLSVTHRRPRQLQGGLGPSSPPTPASEALCAVRAGYAPTLACLGGGKSGITGCLCPQGFVELPRTEERVLQAGPDLLRVEGLLAHRGVGGKRVHDGV